MPPARMHPTSVSNRTAKLSMTSIDKHIERLLATRSYVSVPGLGAFVSRRIPAAVESDTISAPALSTAFDHYPDIADDGLTASVARATGCDTTTAAATVEADVQFVNQQLAIEGHYAIAGVGTLLRNADGSIGFEQQAAEPWLPALTLTPLKAPETVAAVAAPAMSDAFARSLRRTASSAAAIAIFAFLAFIFTQLPLGRNNTDKPLSAGLTPAAAPARPTIDFTPSSPLVLILNTPADASETVSIENASVDGTDGPGTTGVGSDGVAAESRGAIHSARLSEVTSSTATESTIPASTAPAATTTTDGETAAPAAATPARGETAAISADGNADDRYCLIVASLANADEAAKYLATAPDGLRLIIIDGRYRIAALTGPTYTAVQRAATTSGLLARYPSAWICRR